VRSPGWPARPNELLKYEPSTVMLFIRLSWPAKVPDPVYSGESRATSLMRPEIVGRAASSSRSTAVEAPVCDELNTESLWPTTPVMEAVVTPCPAAAVAHSAHDDKVAIVQTIRDLIEQFIASSRLEK